MARRSNPSGPKKPAPLQYAGEDLWHSVTKDIKPLASATRKKRQIRPGKAPTKPAGIKSFDPGTDWKTDVANALPTPLPAREAAMAFLSAGESPGVDRRTAARFKRGQMPLDGRLDLHGYNQDEARQALARFLARAEAEGWRCILIITGKGQRTKPGELRRGVLRENVPLWLNEAPNRTRILTFSSAQPRDGGAGALYVLLKRRR